MQMASQTPPRTGTSSEPHSGGLSHAERDVARADFATIRARLQTPSPRGRQALDMSPEEVMDLVQISKSPPCHPRPYYYRPGQLGEEIRANMRRRLDTTRAENRFRVVQVRHDPIIPPVPVLSVRSPVFRGGVGVQGSRIMAILASRDVQILPAHVGMAPVPIVATSTSHSVERSVSSALGVDGLQRTRILQLLNSRGTAVEARLALAREREMFDTNMLERRALARERADMLKEIERARETPLLQIRTERALFFREVENRFVPIVVPLSPLVCDRDEPIIETMSEVVHGLSLLDTLVEIQSTLVRGVPDFHTVAIIEGIEDTRTVLLAQITSYPAINDHSRVLHFMALDSSSGLYFPSLTYAQHPTWSLVFTSMEIADISGGLSLRSPSLDELLSMPLPSVTLDPATDSARPSRGYIGGRDDVFPSITIGLRHIVWYRGLRYFRASSHVVFLRGVRTEFWGDRISHTMMVQTMLDFLRFWSALLTLRPASQCF